MNQSYLVKNGLQCALNRGIWSTSVTNGAFLFSLRNHAYRQCHSMHYVCRPCAFCSCICRLECKALSNQSVHVRYLYLHVPSLDLVQRERERVSGVLADITTGLWDLIQSSNRSTDCAMCAQVSAQ